MNATGATLARGDVVARAGAAAVVWDRRAKRLTLLPIVAAGELRRRGDVEITDADVVGSLAARHGIVRCSAPVTVTSSGQVRLGRLVAGVIDQVVIAVARAEAADRIEATPPIQSHLSRTDCADQRGRRVGAKSAT